MDLSKALSNGFYFAAQPRKLSALTGIYLIYAVLLLIPIGIILSAFQTIADPTQFFRQISTILSGILLFIVLALVVSLFDYWVRAAFTHNAGEFARGRKELSVMQSFGPAAKRYLHLLAATILVAIISGAVYIILSLFAAIPFIGLLFALLQILVAIFLVLAFLFVPYAAVLSGKGVVEVVKECYEIFRENPGNTFVIALVTMVISGAIMMAALIPAIATVIALAASTLAVATPQLKLALALQLLSTPGYVAAVIISAIVAVFGIAFGHLFTTGSFTTAYLELGNAKPAAARKTVKRRPARKARKRK